MKIVFDDREFADEMLVAGLRRLKTDLDWQIKNNEYSMEADKVYDEYLLGAVETVIEYFKGADDEDCGKKDE